MKRAEFLFDSLRSKNRMISSKSDSSQGIASGPALVDYKVNAKLLIEWVIVLL